MWSLLVAEMALPKDFEILQRMGYVSFNHSQIASKWISTLRPPSNSSAVQALWIDAQIVRLALPVLAQVMERMLDAKLLQVQHDPHTARGRRTPVTIQDYAKRSPFYSN